jgi:hypothetical protein
MNLAETLEAIYNSASIPINIAVTIITAAIIRWATSYEPPGDSSHGFRCT